MSKHRMTVEAIVFNEDGRLLLVKQGNRRKGKWELPGGHVKAGESIFDAVKREVEEETSVSVEPLHVVQVFYVKDEDVHDFIIFCGLDGLHQTAFADGDEIAEAEWTMMKFLPTPMAKFTADRIADTEHPATHMRVIAIDSKDWVGE